MYTVQDIANLFLNKISNITNKKLQKLVYYAYSWYLVLNNEEVDKLELKLFENKFEAWVHGAVYPELYAEYKKHGSGVIPKYEGKLADFSEDELDVLNQVIDVYGEYTGNELESICHQESPWMTAREGLQPFEPSNNPIEDVEIFRCYSKRL
ncbi:putative phage-associated protein [Clostridium algifaecis]|uniref:Phage-associated protein n=1 Tax=Clostridium algifaecis TaxID=1472040 RepID=A0ABS4KRQ5_9CLOT|nr:type II toxin-antitoxin system antitoxin SocA domain-containing protein [Clostridium algifaecis]MBP2032713.1 putative phage-associated protein [Clostridium algifaecis]